MTEPPLISVENVWFSYPRADWALRHVNLCIKPGDYLSIIGPNGAGKTTLAKLLNGLLLPSRGRVLIQGQNSADMPPAGLAAAVGYLFQNPDHQIFKASTREEISFGPRNLNLDEQEVKQRTAEALARFALSETADMVPAMLSFPLRRKVALAAVYAMRPRLIILDEPTGGLDRDSIREVMAAIADLHQDGHAIVLISHNMKLLVRSERVILLQEGSIQLDASPRQAFAETSLQQPQISQLSRRLAPYGLPAPALTVKEFVQSYALLYQKQRQDQDSHDNGNGNGDSDNGNENAEGTRC